jgi:hypothetical protein
MTYITQFFKYLLLTTFFFFIIALIWVNTALHYQPTFKDNINHSVLHQLQYLKDELHQKNAANQMQAYYPEGFFFTNVLYGLAWVDVIEKVDTTESLYREGISEICWAIEQLLSEEGRLIANPTLPLPDGAFYCGWSSYLMGKYVALNQSDNHYRNLFTINCLIIKKAIEQTDKPYLESYMNAAWPADNILCLASLKLHDKILPPQYSATIAAWLGRIKNNLDTDLGMIPHSYNLLENKGLEGVRGSSQSLMLSFLPAIDSAFARQQYALYTQHFVDYRLSLPAIREYPKSTSGFGDVDSGPVIWGIGASAAVVGLKAHIENQGLTHYEPSRNAAEAFGFGIDFQGKKKYIFGTIAVADAFMAWVNAKTLDCAPSFWQGWFHAGSLIFAVLFVYWIKRLF